MTSHHEDAFTDLSQTDPGQVDLELLRARPRGDGGDTSLPLDLDVDDAPVLTTSVPGREAYLAAGIPWDLAATLEPDLDPEREAATLRRRLAELAEDERRPAGALAPRQISVTLDRSEAGLVIAIFRRTFNRMIVMGDFDLGTVDLALRLGDLLAACGDISEALTVYRALLERLRMTGHHASVEDRVAERAGAVINLMNPEAVEPIATELAQLLRTTVGGTAPEDTRHIYDEMVVNARRDTEDVLPFAVGLRRLQEVTTSPLTTDVARELDQTAMRSGAAAAVRLRELGRATDLERSSFGALLEAIMDTEALAAFSIPVLRGNLFQRRFMTCCVLRSPLESSASYDQHVRAVLSTRLRSRPAVTLRQIVSLTGSFPEESGTLIRQRRDQYGLTDRDIFINCPHLLRGRAGTSEGLPSDAGRAVERMGSLVVTSLGWGGAADVGSLLAERWGWGFGTAADNQRLFGFGDWVIDPRWQQVQTNAAVDLLTAMSMVQAVPHLPKRVVVLDEPRAATAALIRQSWLGTDKWPVPIVMIEMNEQRLRWVAKHLITAGGRFAYDDAEVEGRFLELQKIQQDLRVAVERQHRPESPVMIVPMDDHLDDGYAELAGNDPVDEDFDCFNTTAQRIGSELEVLVNVARREVPA